MDISKLRQDISNLNRRRNGHLHRFLRAKKKMIAGSLYQMSRRCGNPNCKCAKGSNHVSWYHSQGINGKTKLTYIGRIVPFYILERVRHYQKQQRLLAEIRKIDHKISSALNQIRDMMIEQIEEIKNQ